MKISLAELRHSDLIAQKRARADVRLVNRDESRRVDNATLREALRDPIGGNPKLAAVRTVREHEDDDSEEVEASVSTRIGE